MHPSIHTRVVLIASALLPACNQLEAIEGDSGGGGGVPPVVQTAFEESCGKAGCHGESGPTAPVLAGPGIADLIGTKYVTIGDLAASQIAVQMLPDTTLAQLGVTRPNPLRMPLDQDYFNPNNYIILAWIGGAEFEGGGGGETGGGSSGGEGSTGPSEPLEPTFTNVQAEVLSNLKCSCHYSAPNMLANGNLELSTDVAYENLVGVPSGDIPAKNYVTPMDAENSYLYMKITAAMGILKSPMPLGDTLTPEQTDLVKRWIEAGAPND